MTKAQEMLAKAGFPDTKQGRAAFHKMYPSPEDFFKVHGNVFKDFPDMFPIKLPIKPENVMLNHSPDRDYYLENTPINSPETDDDSEMYKSGGGIHIKPSKRGTFTAAAKKHGKSVQAFASQVLANKGNYSSAMVKKANFARNAAKWKHEDGGPVMYGDGTKVYSTSNQNTSQVGNNYQNTYQTASTNIDPDGNTSQQFIRQTNNPNQTPYFRYFNDDALGSEINIAGGNGNNMFFTPDSIMGNFLKTRSNYLSGAMAGEQMKRNGGTVDAYQLMGMPTPKMYGPGSVIDGGDEPWKKDIKPELYILDTDENGNPVGRRPPNLPRHKSNYGMSNFMGNLGTNVGNFLENVGDNINPQLAFRPVKQKRFSFDNKLDVEFETNARENDKYKVTGDYTPNQIHNFGLTFPGGRVPALFTAVRANAPGTAGLYGQFTPTVTTSNAYGIGKTSTGQTEIGFNPRINLTKHQLLSDKKRGDAMVQFQPSIYGGAGYDTTATTKTGTLEEIQPFKNGTIGTYYGGKAKLNLNLADLGLDSNMTFHTNPYLSYDSRRGSQVGVDVGVNSSWPKGGREEYGISGGYNFDTKRPFLGAHISLPLLRQRPAYRDIPMKQVNFGFADGGYIPSYNFGHVQSANNTYRHGFANGGPVGMYGFGSTIKDLGYGMADMSLGTIGGLTGIQSMQDIVDEDQYSNDKFDDVTNFAGKLQSAVVKNIPGVGQVVGAVGGGLGALANTTFKIDERNYDPSQHTSNWDKWGNIVGQAGDMASMFTNPASAASSLSKGAKTAMNIGKIAGLGATAVNAGRDIDKSRGGTYDPTNALNLGMGIAKSGFFGGNTNTSGNFGNNTKGAVDYTPSVDSPLYAAMGGAVNAPNMMKYDNGSSVSNTDNLSPKDQYNLFLKAKPVTKYFSNAQVPHPADGSMDPRGTVTGSVDPQTGEPIQINIEKNEANWKLPNSTNFITTKKDTEKILAFDKNNDGIAKASYMANIARAKAIKDAKAKSMMANGGMVGQYSYGGGVMKYDRGSNIPPIDSSMSGAPSYNNYNLGPIMGEGFYNPEATFNEYQNLENINSEEPLQLMTTRGINTNLAPFTPQTPSAFSMRWNNMLAGNADLGEPKLLPGEAYDNQIYTPTSTSNVDGTPTPSWFDRNKEDLKTAGGKALMYGPGIYNIMRSFGKPFQMNAADYQIKGTVNPYEEEYVADYRPYNAAVANLNRMPGSANLAARTNLFNAMQQQQDDARYKNSLANAQRKMTADQAKLGIEGQNLNTAMQIAQLNEQNRAAKRNMLGQGFSDLSNIAQFERTNAMTGNALASIMQHYTVLPDGTMIPKAGYNPAAYSAIYNAGNTSTTNSYDPNLVSPNRYMNQGIDFTYSKPSFRKR
jgi:hypothetical protein